jgi:hypothetical protein
MKHVTVLAGLAFMIGRANNLSGQDLVGELAPSGAGGYFGVSVSRVDDVNGDGVSDMLVGAYRAFVGTKSLGRVYLFSGRDLTTIYQIDGSQKNEAFGACVKGIGDIDGDGSGDLLLAAPYYDVNGMTDAGEVRIYSGSSGMPIRIHDGEYNGDGFGLAIDVLHDIDGDGVNDYMIAAKAHTIGAVLAAGRVYIYSGATGVNLFNISGTSSYQQLGVAICRLDDIDGDGIGDLAIASEDSLLGGGSGRGRIEIYSGGNQSLLSTIPGQAPYDNGLGASLSSIPDFDGDGICDLVAGDPYNTAKWPNGGAVFVYSGSNWANIGAFYGKATDDFYGACIDASGDLDGDGVNDIVVGSWIGIKRPGAAFLISGATASQAYRFDSHLGGDMFGCAVASLGDITGDGIGDVLVGADSDQFQTGRADVFAGNDLFLDSNRSQLHAGDNLVLSWHGRTVNALSALAVVGIGTVGTFVVADLGNLDSQGGRTLVATVPSGLAGMSVSLQAFAQDTVVGVSASSTVELDFN